MVLKISDQITSIDVVSKTTHDAARINSIKHKYPKERQESKGPTFALTR